MVNVRIGEEVIIDPAEAAMVTEEAAPILFDTMSTWKNARVDVRTGSTTESHVKVREKYQEQLRRLEDDAYLEARARFAVGEHQPYFLAKVFIEAAAKHLANDRRIRLPCESTYEFDINKYPPMPLPKLKHGQRQSSRGRPNENRFVRAPNAKRCGVCQRYGHNERTCEYYEVWFDWKDPNDLLFRNMFSRFLNGNRNRARRAQ